jgi:hypothetical protein
MIRYALKCKNGHIFDGWFRGSDDFDKQAQSGFIICPVCGDASISKSLMAPSIKSSSGDTSSQQDAPVMPSEDIAAQQNEASSEAYPHPVAALKPDVKEQAMIQAVRAFREVVKAHSDYVGPKFADEARKMHYGESETRGIWGEASVDDAKNLLDEGIEIVKLPPLPEEQN